MSEVFTGLVAETRDERFTWRDQQVKLPPMSAANVREKLFDTPPSWLRIESQKSTNSCAAHAGTTCAEGIFYAKSGQIEQLCRNYLYIRGQEQCGMRGDVGCTLGGIIAALRDYGVCPESLWPFTGTYQTNIPRGCDDQAKRCRVTHTLDVESLGYEGFRTCIGQNIGTVLMATSWPLRLWDGHIVEQHQPQGRGGHALAGMFLSSRIDGNGRPYVWVANSHDVASGKAGWLLWSPRAIDSLIQTSQWGCTGITDMSTPAARNVDWTGAHNPFAK